MFLLNRLETE